MLSGRFSPRRYAQHNAFPTFFSVYYIFVELKSSSDKFLHFHENVKTFAADFFDKF